MGRANRQARFAFCLTPAGDAVWRPQLGHRPLVGGVSGDSRPDCSALALIAVMRIGYIDVLTATGC